MPIPMDEIERIIEVEVNERVELRLSDHEKVLDLALTHVKREFATAGIFLWPTASGFTMGISGPSGLALHCDFLREIPTLIKELSEEADRARLVALRESLLKWLDATNEAISA